MLANLFAIADDFCFPGNGCPFARIGEEAQIDVWLGGEIISLSRLVVGMEDEIDAVVLLMKLLARLLTCACANISRH